MFRSVLIAFVFSVLATVAPAQSAGPGAAIEGTITSQLDAFLADDVNRAFTYASPTIKGIFRTPQNFGAMVRNGYPMVWRPAETRFLNLREVNGALWQKVQITDGAGQTHLLDYQMIETPDGWQINAVQLLETPPPSV